MRQFKCNNLKSYDDLNLILVAVDLPSPEPVIIRENIPFMDGSYDFSFVNGLRNYEDRIVKLHFEYKNSNRANAYDLYFYFKSVFCSMINTEFSIDYVRGIFKGTCENISDLKIKAATCSFTVEFKCSPYILQDNYAEDIWDTFNFLIDITEIKEFDVNNSSIKIINSGAAVDSLVVNSSKKVKMIFNNLDYNLSVGENHLNLILKQGENEFVFVGDSKVTFNFKKRVV